MIQRQLTIGFGWSIVFFVVAVFCSLVIVSLVVSLPLLAEAQHDAFLRLAATIGAFRGSPMVWAALVGFSVIFGFGGTFGEILPGTDSESLARYETWQAQRTDKGGAISCLNCGNTVLYQYCQHCGQERDVRADTTFSEFTSHIIPEIINVDIKFLRSLWGLLRLPGELTVAYLRGQRVLYSPPIQLYFVVAAVFFFVSANVDFNVEGLVKQVPNLAAKVQLAAEQERVTTQVIIQRIEATLEAYLPFYTFVMVVIFAAFLKLLYRAGSYVAHFVFSLHFITAFLLMWMAVLLLSVPISFLHKFDFLVLVPSVAYLLIALRNVQLVDTARWRMIAASAWFVLLFFVYTAISLGISIFAL